MGKNSKGKRRVVLDEFKAAQEEQGGVDIETSAGTFSIPPPTLWPDEVGAAARANDDVKAATLLLGGEDKYAEFKAAGGSSTILWSIIKDEVGADVPQSSGSSTS